MINIPGISPIHRRRAVAAFSPLDISGLQLWLDASNISSLYQDAARTTPVASDADVVGAISDLSGNGRHATQSTTANKPIYKAAIQNGRGVVRLDGTNDTLRSNFATIAQPWSVVAVASAASNQHVVNSYDTTNTAIYRNSGGNVALYAGATLTGAAYASMAVILAIGSGASSAIRHNGTESTGNAGTGALTNGVSIGSLHGTGNFLSGDIAEILIYNSSLSTTNRQAVESYLNSKWAAY